MPDAALEGKIETVRGRLSEERAEQLLSFWSEHGALDEATARERLPEVVSVLLDASGEIAGVNSVFAQEVPLIGGRRFWIYRSFLVPEASAAGPEMINAAFGALAEEFDPEAGDPLGLCLLLTDLAEMESKPGAVWSETELLFAGYTPDDAQVRIRYFDDAPIGPGLPNSPTTSDMRALTFQLEDRYAIEVFDETSRVTHEDVIALWEREGAVTGEEAERRVHEVLLVGIDREEGVVAVSSAYLQRNAQLRTDLWYYRTFTGGGHRKNHLAVIMALQARDLLQQRFVEGEDRRGAGIIFELENEGLRMYYNRGLWLPSDYTFIGENERGDHVRVHYFPEAVVPPPNP